MNTPEEKVIQLLQRHGLRNTAPRRTVLGLFLEKDYALAHHNIEELTGQSLDRVTVYRTLKSFVDHGILHEILDDEMKTKYNLCSDECTPEHHRDDHLHFKCERCQRTYCLDESALPPLRLPSGYEVKDVQVLVTGVCARCGKKVH